MTSAATAAGGSLPQECDIRSEALHRLSIHALRSEHAPLAEQEAVLTKLCRGLAAGGVLIVTTGGTDAPDEKQDSCMGPPMYHATLGIPKTLQVLAGAGCVCRAGFGLCLPAGGGP